MPYPKTKMLKLNSISFFSLIKSECGGWEKEEAQAETVMVRAGRVGYREPGDPPPPGSCLCSSSWQPPGAPSPAGCTFSQPRSRFPAPTALSRKWANSGAPGLHLKLPCFPSIAGA